jgi:hypothetical protein
MLLLCPMSKPVLVREFIRFRKGKWEQVRSHCRRSRSLRVHPKAAI